MCAAGDAWESPSPWVTSHPGAPGADGIPQFCWEKLLGGNKDVAGKTIPLKERDHLFPHAGRQCPTVQHACTQGRPLLTPVLASKSLRLKTQKFFWEKKNKKIVFSDVLNGQLRICFNGKQLHSSVI